MLGTRLAGVLGTRPENEWDFLADTVARMTYAFLFSFFREQCAHVYLCKAVGPQAPFPPLRNGKSVRGRTKIKRKESSRGWTAFVLASFG